MPDEARSRILILGHGAMGKMFESLLQDSTKVNTWDRDPETDEETAPLESLAPGNEVVILAVPATPHEELAERLAACLGPETLCLSIAKGLDSDGHNPADILGRHFGKNPDPGPAWAMVYGPMIARDLSRGRAGFALAAAFQRSVAERAARLFADGPLNLRPSDDPRGAAWSAILKNIYVPLVGMADELDLGDNMRGFLVTEALEELAAIVEHLGGKPATAYGLAGLGDLVTTATSPESHHRGLGKAIASGNLDAVTETGGNVRSEGVHAVEQLREHGRLEISDYPLLELVSQLLDDPVDAEKRLDAWIRRRFADHAAP